MAWSWFFSENKGVAVAGFLQRAMSCFFGCFRVKDAQSHAVARPEPAVSRNKNALSSLFLSDDDSLQNQKEGRNQVPELDVRELKAEAKFLKACGTLSETPVEIRKASEKLEDISGQYGGKKSLKFNSWLPSATIVKLNIEKQFDESQKPVKICEEWVSGSDSLVETPSSCMTDGRNAKRVSISSIHSRDIQNVITPIDMHDDEICSENSSVSPGRNLAPSVKCKNKFVHFNSEPGRPAFSLRGPSSESTSQCSEQSMSPTSRSVVKESPYLTPQIINDMQTPGTVFPAYVSNRANESENRICSQYVSSVSNPFENLSQWKELKDESSDSKPQVESLKQHDEATLISTLPSDLVVNLVESPEGKETEYENSDSNHMRGTLMLKDEATPKSNLVEKHLLDDKEMKNEASLSSWLKPSSAKQEGNKEKPGSVAGENVYRGRTPADRPILGMVAAHWNVDELSHISPKWWDGNGIPNSTNKYKEDQKVSWHATPFEERLEKALSEESSISQRKAISGMPPVEFHETEESDTALSHLQSPAHLKSVASF